MKILVTGASGFVGQHLLDRLASSHSVVGTTHSTPMERLAGKHSGVTFRSLDILDGRAVQELVAQTRPDACFHLAGVASVDLFASRPRECLRINVEGWLNLLEAFKKEAPSATLVLISSAQVYGSVDPARLPVTEESPLAPGNFYSISKGTCEWLAGSYSENFGMRLVVLRPFNHIGPGQSTSFVCSSLAKQIAEIGAGLRDPVLHTGNLSTSRDFTDVRDIARAYLLALGECRDAQPYNICSGKAVAVEEILQRLLAIVDLQGRVTVESTRKRELDLSVLYGSAERFRRQTGWVPEIPLEQTLRDTLEYWKKKVHSEKVSTRAAL